MAKTEKFKGAVILGQRCPHNGKLFFRGAYTMKKPLWDDIKELCPEYESLELIDDLGGKTFPATYSRLCNKLSSVGRATLTLHGVKEFLIIDGFLNHIRPWDVDEDGELIANPQERPKDDKEGE